MSFESPAPREVDADGRWPPVLSQARSSAPGAPLVIDRYEPTEPWRWDPHLHNSHQLLWAPTGTLQVEAEARSWLLPPTLGLWMPAGVLHAVDGTRPAEVYALYFAPARCPLEWTVPTVIAVSVLLRELVLRLGDPNLADDARARTEAVLYDAADAIPASAIHVPVPSDARLREITDALVRNPADRRGVPQWSRDVGASARTITRLFTAETGMTFAEWRMQVRMRAALAPLAEGRSVAQVATMVGYGNASAFVHAFHRVTGHTPGAFFSQVVPEPTIPTTRPDAAESRRR